MARVLYLAHRLPFPPDKGDKIHSYHVLRHLSQHHQVVLGTFIDNTADEAYIPQVRSWCDELHFERIDPKQGLLRGLQGLWTGQPVTERFYHSPSMTRWVADVCHRRQVEVIVVFSSTMTQFAFGHNVPVLVDFCDVDSAKWAEYAHNRPWPLSLLYRREAKELARVERDAARRAHFSFFATEAEADLFRGSVPDVAAKVGVLGNGVDGEYFSPDPARPSPFEADELALVFTGAMDYWPNVDAVVWFARRVIPSIRARHPRARLHVVGRNPAPAVRALAGAAVSVTGSVPDVRPYLQHAAIVVAPLRMLRGVPNKVLEGMAMRRPVLAATGTVHTVHARAGVDIVCAGNPEEYVQAADTLLRDRDFAHQVGQAAREGVLIHHRWPAQMRRLEDRLEMLMRAKTDADIARDLPDGLPHPTAKPAA